MTIGQRRKKLEEMARGNGLSDAYTTTLTRLKGQKGNKSVLGMKVLMWVLYSERPLRAEELCHALGVEIGSADLDRNNLPALRTLLASCLGLVTVEVSSSIVRFVHFTLQEHLLSDPTLFHSPHSTIAEVCLTYLNFGYITDLLPIIAVPSTIPFVKYASCYWGSHTRIGMTENVKILALKLLDTFDEHISAELLLLSYKKSAPHYRARTDGPTGFTGLHAVAFLGIVELVPAVLEMKEWDINAADYLGFTALTWAAARGHAGVVKILLEREDINLNQPCTLCGRGPLAWAAKGGHEGIVKMLLERGDANPDRKYPLYIRRPLSCAARYGHVGIVKLLLDKLDANPEEPIAYDDYSTPLLSAAYGGHEVVIRMLLERADANSNQPDSYDGTPLFMAAQEGHEEVVKMLLERKDVNAGQPDKDGWTPLIVAAQEGHEGIVKMLLERVEVNAGQPDTKYDRTPLALAAQGRHEGIVKMLLEREDVNAGQPNTEYGRTPLTLAAYQGHEGVVKMLLEREDVNAGQPDGDGWTPLFIATRKGHEEVVKMLLERDDVMPASQIPKLPESGFYQRWKSLIGEP